MRRLVKLSLTLLHSPWCTPLVLLLVCVAAYGLWLPRLGFYWDSWPMNWIAQTMGSQGLARYFSTNRPVWGLFYQLTTPLLGVSPLPWQVSALLLRWLTGVAVWALVRLGWPEQKPAAAWISLLFVVYPGFQQQSIGLLYTHFFIVLNAYLWSLVATLAALRQRGHFWLLTAAALLLSLMNLLSMEYFFILELLRPLLIWLVLSEWLPAWRSRWLASLRVWLPYLALFLAAGIWRALFFPYTQNNYQLVVVEQFKSQPLLALWQLALKAFEQLWIVSAQAWRQVLQFPDDPTSPLVRSYWLAVILCALALLAWLSLQHRASRNGDRKRGWWMLAVGGAALLLAGWPFWLTDVPFSLQFAYDRFTLPFMLGISLLLGGAFYLLPLGRYPRAALLAGLVSLAVGSQIITGYTYVQDWNAQKNLFWQLTWRAPGIQEGTLLISNELRFTPFTTDNSLTAPLNWIYAPHLNDSWSAAKPGENKLAYLMVYPSIRLGYTSLPDLKTGLVSFENYLVAEFHGSTDQALAIYFQPPGCLHVLEPWQASDGSLPDEVRQSAGLSNTALILPAPAEPARPMVQIFGEEIPHGWCYYYQKASLARQQQEWQRVLALRDEAVNRGLKPGLPAEWMPFIEAEARLGNWPRAQQMSLETALMSPSPRDLLCVLWQDILVNTPPTPDREAAYSEVQVKLACEK